MSLNRAFHISDKTMEFQLVLTAPGFPFEYAFLDETIGRLYSAEMRIGDLARAGTALAVFISCLGLFGRASFTAEQRTKEIGIRKVLGASTAGVTALLTRRGSPSGRSVRIQDKARLADKRPVLNKAWAGRNYSVTRP